jgi:hypothetical protein
MRSRACDASVEVVVHNESGRSVHLGNAYAAYLGPNAGTVVRTAPSNLLDGATSDGLDARCRLGRALGLREDATFQVVVAFRPGGCNDNGTSTTYGWPTLELTALGRGHTIASEQDFRFHRTGLTPGCRRM